MARIPDQIGKYNVLERIGKGGMGMVYKAEHPTLERSVILKKLNISGDPVMRERFRREAEIMIDFRTDYVVDVYDHFKHGSSDYIVLEYIDGIALDELVARERYLDSDLALFIIRDCFRGLEYVHSKGVVHRDVKPGNVLVGRDGSVKLLDFGIASRGTGFQDELTREGMTLGTVAYIAPEQIERSRDVDRRADIYSAGAMLYEMVTGRKPFTGGFTPETVNRIQRGRYRRARRVNPRVSPIAARVIARCMRRKPRRRFQHAASVVALLDAYFRRRGEEGLRERLQVLAGAEAAEPVSRRRGRRRLWPRLAAAGVLVLLAVGAVGWLTGTIQRLVLGRTHALARVEVRLRKTDREVPEHYIRFDLAREENGELIPTRVPLPLMRPASGLETPDYVVLRSRLLTLPAGRYRSTFRVEDTVLRAWTPIAPLDVDPDESRLSVQWDPVEPELARLELELYDAATGDEVPVSGPDAPTFLLRAGANAGGWRRIIRRMDGWVYAPARATPADRLGAILGAGAAAAPDNALTADYEQEAPEPLRIEPGATVEVRVEQPDYLSAVTVLDTSDGDAIVRVRLGLVPRPATVLINSRLEEARLIVNDDRWMVAARELGSLVQTPALFAGVTEVNLVPGRYRLAVERAGGEASDVVRVQLRPGESIVLRVEQVNERKLEFRVVEGRQ